MRFECVFVDAGYGSSAPFRHALSTRGLRWVIGISRLSSRCDADLSRRGSGAPAAAIPDAILDSKLPNG